MKNRRIAYLATTGLFCLGILPGGIMDLVQPEMVVDVAQNIGLPTYILTLIGIWKLLGIVALARPSWRRANEWAYAGFFFDLTGAAWCHAAGGDALPSIIIPLVFLLPLGVSYAMRDAKEAPAPAALAGA